jgi:hypothetical protein
MHQKAVFTRQHIHPRVVQSMEKASVKQLRKSFDNVLERKK